jgi:hypothetical protein
MENIEKRKEFDRIISNIDSPIVCNLAVGVRITEMEGFISNCDVEKSLDITEIVYKIGEIGDKEIYVDRNMKFSDVRIYSNGEEILNLSDHGFEALDLM